MLRSKNIIYIASDHAGFILKKKILSLKLGLNFYDLGTSSDESVDYPDFANKLSKKISREKNTYGILICGSGIGMSMVANRHKNVRAALCLDEKMSKLAREHNNANVLVLGSRLISEEEAIKCLLVFFKTEFEGGRHEGRLNKFNNVDL